MYWVFGLQDLFSAKGLATGSERPSAGPQGTRSDTMTVCLPFPPSVMSGGRRQDNLAALEDTRILEVLTPHSQERFRSCNQIVAAPARHGSRQPEIIRWNQERRGVGMATLSGFYASLPLRCFVLISRGAANAASPATTEV